MLAAYAQCGNITRAATAAGVARSMHYLWLQEPEYADAFDRANDEAVERMEEEARRRAVEGVTRYKFDKGRPILHPTLCICGAVKQEHDETGCARTECKEFLSAPYTEHEYSDTLLIFLLKGAKPERYRERVEHTGEVRALVVRDIDSL